MRASNLLSKLQLAVSEDLLQQARHVSNWLYFCITWKDEKLLDNLFYFLIHRIHILGFRKAVAPCHPVHSYQCLSQTDSSNEKTNDPNYGRFSPLWRQLRYFLVDQPFHCHCTDPTYACQSWNTVCGSELFSIKPKPIHIYVTDGNLRQPPIRSCLLVEVDCVLWHLMTCAMA